MTTDKDILAALTGEPRPGQQSTWEAISASFRGGPTAHERAHTSAILEALDSRSGEPGEAVAVWAATEAAATATKALAEVIMRADGTKGIYAAESEAKDIAAEAYAEAAKRTPSEVDRQNTVARVTAKLSESLKRMSAAEGRKPLRPATTVAAKARPTIIENFRGDSRVVK